MTLNERIFFNRIYRHNDESPMTTAILLPSESLILKVVGVEASAAVPSAAGCLLTGIDLLADP